MNIRVMNDEVWRDIENYEGLYQISNFGRVKSLHYEREKILKLSNAKDGYLQITLQKNGGKSFQIHRLVANAFIPTQIQIISVRLIILTKIRKTTKQKI